MEQITLIVPFKFLKVGISDFAVKTLSLYGVSMTMIATVCTDFITEFSYTNAEGLVLPEPLVLSRFIQSEFHSALSHYVLERYLFVPLEQRVPNKMVFQIIADVAFVMAEELMPVIRQYITSSRYPIDKVHIGVSAADLTAVQLEFKYDPLRRPTYKFCHYDPAPI